MNISNISLRQLRIFLAVAEHHSFSRAGNMVSLTQSAMSHSIGDLENELGVRLFKRTTREVVLTQEGADLSQDLRRVLGDLETTLCNVQSWGERRRGLVHVATSPTISAGIMPDCIAQIAENYPHVNLVIHDRVQQQAMQMVMDEEVDFGVVIEPAVPSDLYTETFMEEPFCLVLPEHHPIARLKRVTWCDLQNQELVLLDYASGSRPLIDNALIRHGVTPHVIQELGHVTTIFRILQSGIGVSVIPQLALSSLEFSGLAVRQLWPIENRRLQLVRRRNRSLSTAATAVWTLIQTLCQA
ncbi:LysR family transcriptional regulator [Dickeya undicola]|uniref:LysR family transcriptional regulator n=1 Tax=Dickeya undicola TaxID=1577887 RepID=A0A3N0G6S5_9GAMM|nr:LysR family transcriptional regulator [Dickeya undicola]RNM08195.1 LysR family transcriptional regulator [Dickeya undicola]RNM19609.1 LysR family transcriptional regulator [Dickeya undicola]